MGWRISPTRGSWVDLAAPGENILSSLPDDEYGTWSGTSMATPLAAGTAALARAALFKPEFGAGVACVVSESASIAGPVSRRVDAAQAVGLPPSGPIKELYVSVAECSPRRRTFGNDRDV